jgi:murein DD-endopeptidase MepM/ murein hydrolase activator NlpD
MANISALSGGNIYINNPSPFWTAVGIKIFRAIRALKKGIEYFFIKIVWAVIKPVGKVLIGLLVLPIYKLVILTKLRIQRLALPARGFVLFLVTNRYLFHASILAISVVTIWANLQTRQVLAQDIGKHSLLYSLMSDSEAEIVSEQTLAENVKPSEARYSQGTIEAVPHIDFDYRPADETADRGLSFTIPGTVALEPMDHQANNLERIRPERRDVETYLVKEGDTLGTIARDYGVNVGTILWANNLTERQYIRPGDQIKILPVSGVLATVRKGETLNSIAQKYSGDADEIARQNNLNDGQVKAGMELVIPGGEPPQIEQTRAVAVTRDRLKEPGATGSSASLSVNPVSKPADASEKPDAPKTKLFWPTSGHVITQYYGWRHTGLDIDGDFTSPLYAAEDGVVSTAGWNSGGYGLMILIDHPNGLRTRYGHASKLFVKAGDTVHRGQVIAMMGSTGRSTGSHLHFEVYISGRRVNPLVYIR